MHNQKTQIGWLCFCLCALHQMQTICLATQTSFVGNLVCFNCCALNFRWTHIAMCSSHENFDNKVSCVCIAHSVQTFTAHPKSVRLCNILSSCFDKGNLKSCTVGFCSMGGECSQILPAVAPQPESHRGKAAMWKLFCKHSNQENLAEWRLKFIIMDE